MPTATAISEATAVVSAAAISVATMSAIGGLSTLPTGTAIVTDATTRLRRIGYPIP